MSAQQAPDLGWADCGRHRDLRYFAIRADLVDRDVAGQAATSAHGPPGRSCRVPTQDREVPYGAPDDSGRNETLPWRVELATVAEWTMSKY